MTAAALTKLAVAYCDRVPVTSVRIDRRCNDCGAQHGRPHVVGSELQVSVSHSASVIAVAVAKANRIGSTYRYDAIKTWPWLRAASLPKASR